MSAPHITPAHFIMSLPSVRPEFFPHGNHTADNCEFFEPSGEAHLVAFRDPFITSIRGPICTCTYFTGTPKPFHSICALYPKQNWDSVDFAAYQRYHEQTPLRSRDVNGSFYKKKPYRRPTLPSREEHIKAADKATGYDKENIPPENVEAEEYSESDSEEET